MHTHLYVQYMFTCTEHKGAHILTYIHPALHSIKEFPSHHLTRKKVISQTLMHVYVRTHIRTYICMHVYVCTCMQCRCVQMSKSAVCHNLAVKVFFSLHMLPRFWEIEGNTQQGQITHILSSFSLFLSLPFSLNPSLSLSLSVYSVNLLHSTSYTHTVCKYAVFSPEYILGMLNVYVHTYVHQCCAINEKISIVDYYKSTLRVITMLRLINTKAVGDQSKRKAKSLKTQYQMIC